MAKKMSVEEILAAARAGKATGGAAPALKSEASSAAETPAPVAELVSESPLAEAPKPAAAAGKVPPGGKGMDMAAILAAARASKSGAPAATPAAKPAPKKEVPAKTAVAEKPAGKPAAKPAGDGNGASAPKDTASILAAARKSAKPGPMSKSEAAALAKPAEPTGKKRLDVPPMPAKPEYARARPAPSSPA
jgi:hypothetical protein